MIYYYNSFNTRVNIIKKINVFSNFSRPRFTKKGRAKELFDKFEIVKKIYKEADDLLELPISKIIFEGPEDKLNLTENTQPAIFLPLCNFYSGKKEFGFIFDKTKFIAGHSLGIFSFVLFWCPKF